MLVELIPKNANEEEDVTQRREKNEEDDGKIFCDLRTSRMGGTKR